MEIGMRREEEVRLTHSGIFAKDGRRCVSVRFERGRDKNDEIFAKAKEINPIRGIL